MIEQYKRVPRDPLAAYELDTIVDGLIDDPDDVFVCHYLTNVDRLKRLGFEVSLKEYEISRLLGAWVKKPNEYLVSSVASEVSSGVFQKNKESIQTKT
jgi:hypothetical protein